MTDIQKIKLGSLINKTTISVLVALSAIMAFGYNLKTSTECNRNDILSVLNVVSINKELTEEHFEEDELIQKRLGAKLDVHELEIKMQEHNAIEFNIKQESVIENQEVLITEVKAIGKAVTRIETLVEQKP